MTTFILREPCFASLDELSEEDIGRKDTVPRALAELAVGRALRSVGFIFGEDDGPAPVGGIVGSVSLADDFPNLVRRNQGRLKPHQFSSSVMNSLVGHCAIRFDLTGPQISVTQSCVGITPYDVALAQVKQGRAHYMVILHEQHARMRAATLSAVAI